MTIEAIAFYVLAGIAILAALAVVLARNPVHSVLFLILTFFSSAGLFVLMGAEFLAMLLIVVYVGAVAVLFLFVVMMLDIDFAELKRGFVAYMPLGAILAAILFGQLMLVGAARQSPNAEPVLPPEGSSNVQEIGRVLYTEYVFLFQVAGLILFVAMVGAIVLTLRQRPGVRRQDIARQVGRKRGEAISMADPVRGAGLAAQQSYGEGSEQSK